MTPGPVSRRVVAERLGWVDTMLAEIRSLPLADRGAFLSDRRNVRAAESCLRRALEALFDLGRHLLAKGFGDGTAEYKAIAARLGEVGVLQPTDVAQLQVLAGYRNRMVHFDHEISVDELYDICAHHLDDISGVAAALRTWSTSDQSRLSDEL